MVNSRLVTYIEEQLKRGVDESKIKLVLLQSNWDAKEISEAFNKAKGGNRKIIMFAAMFLIIIGSVAGAYFSGALGMIIPEKELCGNGEIDEGETPKNCCIDAGCYGEQSCENGICVDPACGDCQYLENYECMDYECCENSDCTGNKTCFENECVEVECTEKQYFYNNSCHLYTCIDNEDCDDGDESTADKCIDPKTMNATCSYNEIVEVDEEEDNEIKIKQETKLSFDFEEEEHEVELENVTEDSAVLIFYSEPKKIEIKIGETKKLDIDDDGLADFLVTLNSIIDGEVNFVMKKIKCRIDAECNDNNETTLDTCLEPETVNSTCDYEIIDECETDADCDDEKPYTKNICYGSDPSECIYSYIEDCEDDDGYCPDGCYNSTDNDCVNVTQTTTTTSSTDTSTTTTETSTTTSTSSTSSTTTSSTTSTSDTTTTTTEASTTTTTIPPE